MSRVILYIAKSIDGFISGPNDEMDWIPHSELEDFGYEEFYNSIDITIMGKTTFDFIDKMDIEFPYKPTKNYVFTNNLNSDNEYVEFVNEEIVSFIKNLKNSSKNKRIWVIGGRAVIHPLIKENLFDEYQIADIPVILSKGKPLFPENKNSLKLNLKESKAYSNGTVFNTYYKV